MTKEDILDYINSLRKPSSLDPTHKSIGTWNARLMLFLKFFRGLYNHNEPDLRKRETPACMNGINNFQERKNHHTNQMRFGLEKNTRYILEVLSLFKR